MGRSRKVTSSCRSLRDAGLPDRCSSRVAEAAMWGLGRLEGSRVAMVDIGRILRYGATRKIKMRCWRVIQGMRHKIGDGQSTQTARR